MLYYFIKTNIKAVLLFVMLINMSLSYAQGIHKHIEVSWEVVDTQQTKKGRVSKLIVQNSSANDIPCNGWSLWFNFMRSIDPASVNLGFKIEHRNGDLYRLSFVGKEQVIPAHGSIEIPFVTSGILPNFTDAPVGLYIVYDTDKATPYAVKDLGLRPLPYDRQALVKQLSEQYDNNSLTDAIPQKIIPQPLSINEKKGAWTLKTGALLSADEMFEKETGHLQGFLQDVFGISIKTTSNKKTAQIQISRSSKLMDEEYQLMITGKGIEIFSSTPQGVFYAVQSLKSLYEVNSWNKHSGQVTFPLVEIKDRPRFAYRGLMLDVARNFHSKQAVLKIIDAMAMYKLNTLHLHLNDDEGWRLHIPALPELTEVGGLRDGTYVKGKSLQPSYGSGAMGQAGEYYSVEDFVEILQYARDRHIQVIPELETPGHARAAIKSMQARYHKYMALGNKIEAEKFLLNDFEDRSVYSSAQNWNDNVMNVALPSTYTFISTVIDEMKAMYEKAGLRLNKVHLGGDEVPRGSWEKSPKIRSMMDSLRITSVYDVWPYYINRIADLCRSKGVEMAGWEEMGMINKGNGMEVNPQMSHKGMQLDVWNNLIGGGQEDLAYKLANAGYKVIFTSASNFYLDLAWANNFDEPGHTWAGFTSIRKSYSFSPTNYFLNIFNDAEGNPLQQGYVDNKERLTADGVKNIVGIKAAAWSEKIRNPELLEYMLFPRLVALAEKAWSQERNWEKGKVYDSHAFEKDYAAFMQKLGTSELHKMDMINGGYTYRLPAIGVQELDGMLRCNIEYPGFDIYYTIDGSEPTVVSEKYSGPIKFSNHSTYKFKVFTKLGRAGNTVVLKP